LTTKPSYRAALAAAIAVLALTLVVPAALAGKGHSKPGGGGGGSGSSSLTLVLLNSSDGLPHYGQQVTFTVSTTVTSRPYVRLDCYQGGAYVYSQWAGFYADFAWPWLQTYPLSNSMWTGGAADCTATLYYNNGRAWTNILSQSFHVYA
jgi:hypothetical protein